MSDSCQRSRVELEKWAKTIDRVVVYPEPRELFLDIDTKEALATFEAQFPIFTSVIPATYVSAPSPSGKPNRFHVTVTLSREIGSEMERILFQSLLGSDLKHELLSWITMHHGGECPTVFFEKITDMPTITVVGEEVPL